MSRDSQVFLVFITGLITTAFGVGGVENSLTDTELLQSLAVSCAGLAIMYLGTLIMRAEQ